PNPSLVPNMFGAWSNDDGIPEVDENAQTVLVGSDLAPADKTDLEEHKYLYFRNPYVVTGQKSAYIAFSKISGLSEDALVCDKDIDFYTSKGYYEDEATRLANNIYIGHFPGSVVPELANVNAKCFEIDPNTSADW